MPACLTHISRMDVICYHSPAAEPQKLIVPFALADVLLGPVASIGLATTGAVGVTVGTVERCSERLHRVVPAAATALTAAVWTAFICHLMDGLSRLAAMRAGACVRASFCTCGAAVQAHVQEEKRLACTVTFPHVLGVPRSYPMLRVETCGVKGTRHGEYGIWVGSCGDQATGRGGSAGLLPVASVSHARVAVVVPSVSVMVSAWRVCSGVYTPCKSLQVKPRVGQPSLCTLYTQP